MPRPALSCTVKLKLKQVTCPGTLHLSDRNLVFITVSVLAQTRRTKSVFASFPFIFNEKIWFQRIFTNATNLDQVLEILEGEIVCIELRQYSERYDAGKVLAKFEQPARQFLFPSPSFTPKDGIKREVLLARTPHFSEKGINPKLEFSTNTKIEETTIAVSSREHLSVIAATRSTKKASSKRVAKVPQPQLSSSETEEEIIITTPRIEEASLQNAVQYQHCVCECPNRPENNGRVVVRSRSISPGRDRQRARSGYYKPPFKAGKAPQDLISRRDFGLSPSRLASSFKSYGDGHPCSACLVPHPDCSLCMAYKQSYGNDFLKHRFQKDSKRTRPKSSPNPVTFSEPLTRSRVRIPKVRARIPVSSPESSDSEDMYHAALKVSSERKNRPRMFSRKGDGSRSASRDRSYNRGHVRSTVKDLLQKNDSVLQYELTDSELEDSLLSDISLHDEPVETSSIHDMPDRSIVVPLNGERYWSQKATRFTGRSHRQVFNDSLSEIYKDLYDRALYYD